MTTTEIEDRIRLEPSWKAVLKDEIKKPYMQELRAFLSQQISRKKHIYPKPDEYFAAFNLTPIDQVKAAKYSSG